MYHSPEAFPQAYDANELWHFPRQIIIYLRKYRGYDYHSSDPTEISRIRRIGLLLLGCAGGIIKNAYLL